MIGWLHGEPLSPALGPPETDAKREARLAWESVRLAEAEEDFAAGLFMPDEELDAWNDKWAAGEDVR